MILETAATAYSVANSISDTLGLGSSAEEDTAQVVKLVGQLGAGDKLGPLGLRAELLDGVFLSKSIKEWDTSPRRPGPEQRDFFRMLAVTTGATDPAYVNRTNGAAEALAAFNAYCTLIDKLTGSSIARYVGQSAEPGPWYTAFMAIPVDKLSHADAVITGRQNDVPISVGTPVALSTQSLSASDRLLAELAKAGSDLKTTAGNVITSTVQGAVTGLRTSTGGAASGSHVGLVSTNLIWLIAFALIVFFVARSFGR